MVAEKRTQAGRKAPTKRKAGVAQAAPLLLTAASNLGGRPTKYKPAFCEEILDFFNRTPVKIEYIKTADGKKECRETVCELPTLAGFAAYIGVCRDTLHEWSKQHAEFSDAIKRAQAHQEHILIQNGLTGRYHPAVAIFALKNLAGWRDKVEVDNRSHVELSVKALDEKFGQRMRAARERQAAIRAERGLS